MNICLYGASSTEIDNAYILATEELGKKIGIKGHSLVYGGGASGLMGAAARGVVAGGGKVIGVAPTFFQVDGVLFDKCTEFVYPETMRERKAIMEQRSDAFIVSPGGIGTFDEFFEIYSLKQLGQHEKAVAIFNINGYFDSLKNMLDYAVSEKFMSKESRDLIPFFDNADDLINYFESYTPGQCDPAVLRKVKR